MPKCPDANFYIDKIGYDLIVQRGGCRINEISLEDAGSKLRSFLAENNAEAIFASGLLLDEYVDDADRLNIAAFDWIRRESNRQPGEPTFNVYCFVVGLPGNDGMFPVYGPYKSGTTAPHWTGNYIGHYRG